jgi:ribosomal protein L33
MAAKKAKTLIRLVSTGKLPDGRDTGTFIVRKKNFKTMGDRKLSFMKYDKRIMKHVLFVEKKIK